MTLIEPHTKAKLMRFAAFAKDAALETLWPTRCALCDAPGDLLCPRCRRTLLFVDANRACPVCGAPFGQHQCTECNATMLTAAGRDALPLDGMASVLLADDAARRMVTVYKDANERRLAHEMAGLIARYVPPEWHDAPLTFIPATKDALRRRGFDHAEQLANAVAARTKMPLMHVFARPRNLDQRKFGRRERQRNMSERFSMLPNVQVPQKTVILDDICTTGATLFAAADCLRTNGASKIYGLTFAKVLAT